MADNNRWIVEGFLGKYPKEGTGKSGPWYIQSIGVYAGKDKETQQNKYENISFFVPKDDIERFKQIPQGTKIRLTGKPEASGYIDKNSGEMITKLQMKLEWGGGWEVVENEASVSVSNGENLEEPF